ncbi:MAG: MbcA/ParS/Xre antitoxin family protein [Alphaproteobacteria bacterium]
MPALASSALAAEALPAGALRQRDTREAMTPAAIRLFLRLAERWRLGVADRCALLGELPRPTYYNWVKGRAGTLSRDQMERISLLLGIHKALRLLFADEAAGERWLRAANRDLEFGGRSPLERMLAGGIGDLYAVRRYLDAWRGLQ